MTSTRDTKSTTDRDLSFLAPPGELLDWRMVLLAAAAGDTGILQSLPALPGNLAAELGLDEAAVVVVLEALAQFGVVEAGGDGAFAPGPSAPDAEAGASLHHHARSIGQWARALDDRLRGAPVVPGGPPSEPERWIDALAVHARRAAPSSVDACLARLPHAKAVLDLGGGHGEYALEFARRGLSVTLQDRPVMIDIARRRGTLEKAGVELFAGDFFDTVADGPFDIVFCSGVTNTFDAERNVDLYRRVRPIVAPGGCFVIQTSMRDRQPGSVLFGVQMLVVGNGGDAHPETRYRQWLAAAGHGPPDVVDIDGDRRSLLFAPAAAGT
ncbi:MAG TPA: class I SAM-dependent methyltransferase [Acidimicrobiales bacterium]|nr:class I SAM-dependent methyltransferase [Acidimicrobiales bacterium]